MLRAHLSPRRFAARLLAPERALRRELVGRQAVVLLGVLLVVGVTTYSLTYRSESLAWESRQREAAHRAVSALSDFVARSRDALSLMGELAERLPEERQPVLELFMGRNSAFREMLLLDPLANVQATAHRDASLLGDLFTLRQSVWFRTAQAGDFYLGNMEISSGDEPYLILATPTARGGVAAGRLAVDVLWEVVERLRFAKTGVVYVVDRRGRIVAHPDRQVVLAWTTYRQQGSEAATDSEPAGGTYLGPQGRRVRALGTAVPGTGWTVVTEVEQREATAASRIALYLTGSSVLVFGILALLRLVQQAESVIFRPLEALRLGAERIGRGDLGHRIPVLRSDEVGRVAEAFNEMAQRLRTHEDDLAAHAAALTAEVMERKKVEATLRASEARYRAIVEDQTEMIRRTLPDGTLTFANDAYCRRMGRSDAGEEGLGMSPPGGGEERAEGRPQVTAENPVVVYQGCITGVDGSRRWEQWTDRGIFDESGALVEIQSVGRDITELRETTEELRRAKEEAEAASRVKSDFLARMSHEIRTPMHGLLGMSDLLLTSSLDEKQRRYAETVQASGRTLLGILDDVLDLSRLDADKLTLHVVPFAPADVVQRTVDLFRETARRKGVRVVDSVGSDVPALVQGDPQRLAQILNNLVSNAVKFTDEGEIRVSVCAGQTSDEAAALRFEVEDTGIGIPPDQHRQIFEEFSQVGSFLSRRHGGTGLGLAIAKRLSEKMGGTLELESQLGHGSRFFFTLRFPVLGADAVQPSPSPGGLSPGVPTGRRILLAEDNDVNRELAEELLGLLGFEVDVVANGLHAVQAAGRTRYDLILMDCQMPELDGYEATKRIRAAEGSRDPVAPRVPIVALTGHAMVGEREKCLAAGMDDFLAKPFKLAQLGETLERWLAGRG